MRKILTMLPVLLAALTLFALPYEAEAKRMGFGKSLGKQYSMPQQNRTAPSTVPNSAAAAPGRGAAAAGSGASRWLGPLAGLAAGGLLASLFFGDAFENFQFMDFLLLAGVAFGAFMLFRAMRGRATPQQQLRTASGPMVGGNEQPDATPMGGATAPAMNSAPAPASSEGDFDAPDWFDPIGFAGGAKVHFIRLQAAWDKGDMKDIAEYTTPELFAQLQAERLNLGSGDNFTEVVSLDAELLSVQRDGDEVVASVRFTGLVREEQDAEPQNIAEIWHVSHAWGSAQGDWFIAGIQQFA